MTSPSQSSLNKQWLRTYAKDAKAKGKGKSASNKPVVKKVRVSRTELRKRSVILTHSVAGVGEVGEELKVTRGFARNFLFARNVAKLATPELRVQYAPQLAVRPSMSSYAPFSLIFIVFEGKRVDRNALESCE